MAMLNNQMVISNDSICSVYLVYLICSMSTASTVCIDPVLEHKLCQT